MINGMPFQRLSAVVTPSRSYDAVERHMAEGRAWRAKEILQGRLREAAYDPELFRRYATVLTAMKDDDEAGRFALLGGVVDGTVGDLARAFMARRSRRSLPAVWATMPRAARRLGHGGLPQGTRALLVEAGYPEAAIDELARALAKDLRKRATATRRKRSAPNWTGTRGSRAFAWIVFVLLCVIGALGLLRLIDIIAKLLRSGL